MIEVYFLKFHQLTHQYQDQFQLLNHNGSFISIDSIEEIVGEVEVVNIDVEPLDVYFANGILVHNKGTNSDPDA